MPHRNNRLAALSAAFTVAVVAGLVTSAPAGAGTVPWEGSVTLGPPSTSITNNDPAVKLILNVTGNGGAFPGVGVFDENWNRVYWVSGGTSGGSLSVKPAVSVTHTYTAYVGTIPTVGMPSGILATSAPASVTNVGYVGTLSLTAARPTVTADSPSQALALSALPGVASPYILSVYDDLGIRVYANFGTTTSGSLTVAPPILTTRIYTAYMAQDAPLTGAPLLDVRATSTASVTNVGYSGTITLATNRTQLDAANTTATLTVSTSNAVGYGLSTAVYDESGAVVWYSGFGTSGGSLRATVPVASTTRTFTAYVIQGRAPTTGPAPNPVLATSNSVHVTNIPAADNLLGLSIPVIETAVASRYAGGSTEMCLVAGEVYPAHTTDSSEPDIVPICMAGGIRGMLQYLVPILGAADTVSVLWHLAYGGDPAINTASGVSGSTIEPPAALNRKQDAVMAAELSDALNMRLTTVGTGPVESRRPDRTSIEKIARTCLEQTRLGGATAHDCYTKTVLVPGKDAGAAAENDRDAIASGRPWQVHYVSDVNQGLSRGWYRNKPGCLASELPGATYECDEYPFYSTNEAGPANALNIIGARIQWVEHTQNAAEGQAVNWMPRHCFFTSGSAPNGPLGTHYLVVPLPDLVPITTYFCGSDNGTS